MRDAGARVDVIETGGFPMVLGRFEVDPALPTVTVYNHLDVQPAEQADGWNSPPFQFTREAESSGRPLRWFARGTTDDKGPALAALFGARLALQTDARVNIQFLWELEEEIGSPHFAAGLAAAVAGDAKGGRRAAGDGLRRGVRHHLDGRWAPVDLVRTARLDGVHHRAADGGQGRSLGDDRRPGPQPDRRAGGAHRRDVRRADRAR